MIVNSRHSSFRVSFGDDPSGTDPIKIAAGSEARQMEGDQVLLFSLSFLEEISKRALCCGG